MPNLRKELRKYYHSIRELKGVLDTQPHGYMTQHIVDLLETEIKGLNSKFPDSFPVFSKENFFSHRDGNDSFYSVEGIQSFAAIVLGKLKVEVDEISDSASVEPKDFPFVRNENLRKILERDYQEIQKARISIMPKSLLILCGGAIEAILTDAVLSNENDAVNAKSAPNGKKDVLRWDLSELIDVCLELEIISEGVKKLSHSIREYRNLVHPGREVREGLKFEEEEARIAFEVLNIIIRELSDF